MDPSIYALSDYTRFSRIYKEAVAHTTFNSKEMGSFVALKILKQQLDPAMLRPHEYAIKTAANSGLAPPYQPLLNPNNPNKRRPPLPVFLLPRSMSCDIPGGLNYFCTRLPVIPALTVSYITNESTVQEQSFNPIQRRNRNCVLKVKILLK